MSQIRLLNEELQRTAIEELHEVPEDIPANLEALKTWINQQPHLQARTDDQFLLAFLRGCKFSLEKTKSKLDMFYTMRTKRPDLFRCTDVDQPKFREVLHLGYVCCVLPTPLYGDGPRICLVRCGMHSCEEYNIEDILNACIAIQDIMILEDDQCIIKGLVFLFDVEKATASHVFQATPFLMKTLIMYAERATPFRIKDYHFFNSRAIVDRLFNIIKPMLSDKMRKRLSVHGYKLDSMYEKIPQKYLPKEYGGENGSIEEILIHWEEKIDNYRNYFKDEVDYGTDEKLRSGEPIDFSSIFGLEGSFRKLNVD